MIKCRTINKFHCYIKNFYTNKKKNSLQKTIPVKEIKLLQWVLMNLKNTIMNLN